jgi:hypothetical protein
VIVEWKSSSKQDKGGQLTIKNYAFKRVEHFKYLGVILNEHTSHQRDLQLRIKNANKSYFLLQKCFRNKNMSKKLKVRLKNTIIDKTLTYASETWIPTREREASKHF